MLKGISVLLIGLVILVAGGVAGCNEEEQSGGITVPTLDTPSPSPAPAPTPAPPPTPAPAPTPAPTPDTSAYPHNQGEALGLIEAGVPMAGLLSNGLEVLIMKSTETVYEEQPVQESVCDYRYDSYLGEETYECRNETVYKDRPVTKTIYVMRGGLGPGTYSLATQPFTLAVGAGAVHWRKP